MLSRWGRRVAYSLGDSPRTCTSVHMPCLVYGVLWTPLLVLSHHRTHEMVPVRDRPRQAHTSSWVHPEAAGVGREPQARHRALSLSPRQNSQLGNTSPCSLSMSCKEDTRHMEVYFQKIIIIIIIYKRPLAFGFSHRLPASGPQGPKLLPHQDAGTSN